MVEAREADCTHIMTPGLAVGTYTICQNCVICNSLIEFQEGTRPYNKVYICDECKEAIAFIKDFKASITKQPSYDIPGQGVPKVNVMPL